MPKTKTVYTYDPATLEYTGLYDAQESPLEPGVFIIPEYAIDVAPPAPAAGFAHIAVPATPTSPASWNQVEDHRGSTVYDTATGAASVIDALGPVPAGSTLLAPLTHQTWDAAASAWVDDMVALRSSLSSEVNIEAETARLRHITGGAGQAAVYVTKAAEADAYKAAGYPVPATGYPMLSAEASATGQTPQQVADQIIATRDTWLPIAGAIEGARLAATGANGSIRTAADRATAQAAHDAAVAALQAI